MVNRRYFLVILDPSGRSVRRVAISLKTLQIAAGLAIAAVALSGVLIVHGMVRARLAAETVRLERDNALLREISQQIDERVPEGRMLALRTELTFAQLWAKSDLGPEPNVLAIGPLDDDAVPGSDGMAATTEQSRVLTLEPAALPLELDRLDVQGLELQTELGEMLEYFHDAALLLSNTPSLQPVTRGYLTSSFGKRRDPMNHSFVMHKGLDIGGATGTEIVAPADGVVIFTGTRGGYGLTLVIDHGYGLQTHYAHLSHIIVKHGARVQRGEAVAQVGSSGRSTGPHLHYEVRRNGQPLNPMRFILD